MIKYSVVKNGVVTNEWTSETAGADYYEPSFGSPGEFEIIEEDVTEQVDQEAINQAALAYLASTDWYVIRAQEEPSKPVPSDISIARAAARESIVRD